MGKQSKELVGRRILIISPNGIHARLYEDICTLMGGADVIGRRAKVERGAINLILEKGIDTVVLGGPVDEGSYRKQGGDELDRLIHEGRIRKLLVVSMTADLPDCWDIPKFRSERDNRADVIYFKRNEELIEAISTRLVA